MVRSVARLCLGVLVVCMPLVVGCGAGEGASSATRAAGTTESSGAPGSTPQTPTRSAPPASLPWLTTTGTDPVGERVWAPPPREMVDAFAKLTSALPGVLLYLPRELPQGATLPATWWPVSSGKSPVTWTGSSESNPRVVGRGKNVEVRIVMRIGHGDSWMELAERVKGDLGDLQGDRAGSVAGHETQIYRFMGGDLVQWSDKGAWFALYGRNLPREDLLRAARGMAPVG
jgi:hypothetical protein